MGVRESPPQVLQVWLSQQKEGRSGPRPSPSPYLSVFHCQYQHLAITDMTDLSHLLPPSTEFKFSGARIFVFGARTVHGS